MVQDTKMMKREADRAVPRMPAASMALLSFSRMPSKDPADVLRSTRGLDMREGLQGYRRPICGRGYDACGMTVALAVSGSLKGTAGP